MLYFDSGKNKILKVVCLFDEETAVDKVIVNYHVIDFDYKGKFNDSAFDKVFISKGKLKPSYNNYELIDNRSQN